MQDLVKNLPNITMEAMEEDDRISRNDSTALKPISTFDAKNYLNVKLNSEKGEKSKELRVRILPIDGESSTPFKKIYVHPVRVPKDISSTGFKSYICIEKTDGIDNEKYGHKCPFCELNREAYKKSVEATDPVDKDRYKKLSLAMIAKEACIIRLIDRSAEEDGPKFWKFNVKLDKTDPKNVIKSLYKSRLEESREEGEEENILDIYKGKDFKITISQSESRGEDNDNKNKNKTSVNIIDYGKNKPLSNDEETIKKWVFDPKKWNDVFSIKPYDYLAIIINGGTPWYDKETNKWVNKDDFDKSKKEVIAKVDKEIEEADSKYRKDEMPKEDKSVINTVLVTDDDDDIPF